MIRISYLQNKKVRLQSITGGVIMIKLEQLNYSYTGTAPFILHDINLEVAIGDYISIVGENGCGKTTLMRILLGFLKPTKGNITVDTKFIGYVPQKKDFTNSNFPITVYEALNSYRKLIKVKDKDVIMESLKRIGMENYKNSLLGNLSGGQTQKILIARALMGNPQLLILDEPSTGVDIDSQKEIYGLLKNLSIEQKITILAVEHNLEAVVTNSTKIYHLQNGFGHLCSPDQYATEYLHYKRKEDSYASL
ncbi:MAG: transporter ATP-binding protein [Herbinix sp.]|jgi:zinc transport system ATP-binding protein|nr:transporter ATP-binding protein [Herbinix sp.]